MGGVSVQRRCVVLPSQPAHRQSLFLSSLDIFWQDVHYNERLIFYDTAAMACQDNGQRGQSGQEVGPVLGEGRAAAVMEKLKSSLALCLVHYYPWCGRIAKGADPPHRLFIDCCDAGVEFVEASSSVPLSHLARNGFQINPLFEQLCPHPDHTGDSLYSSPLLSVQATLFSDGGLALGIAQSHIVADGQALWQFLVSWGECARGVPLSMTPVHDREKLALPNPPPVAPDSYLHYKVKEEDICENCELAENGKCTTNDGNRHDETNDNCIAVNSHIKIVPISDVDSASGIGMDTLVLGVDSLVQCVVNLSGSDITKLKHEAHGSYSSYEVICAHFWQRVTIARGGQQNEPAYFSVFANCRNRLSTPLPPAYFGNVIMFSVAPNTVGKISFESISDTAARIHNAIATFQENSLMAFMHWVELNDNHAAFAFIPEVGQMIFMASSPRFPAYEVDFGWGRPTSVRSVKVHGDGELVIFGGNSKSGHGDVEICFALPANVMKRLLEDPQFLGRLPLVSYEISSE